MVQILTRQETSPVLTCLQSLYICRLSRIRNLYAIRTRNNESLWGRPHHSIFGPGTIRSWLRRRASFVVSYERDSIYPFPIVN